MLYLQWELTSGIWCFNNEGTLIWKMPAVFPKDHPVYEGKDTSLYCEGPYYIGFHYDEDKDEIVGQTDEGNRVRVKLRTGELVHMSGGCKM
ncbi:MAG: hypothetical protein HQK51_17205 [Oligoflexia bacterium]|nr:hypothetical protein [Oligoflexia bacterium]